MKYYVIAGEASGDLHGSNLIKALKKLTPDLHIRAWGGDKMQAAGAEVVKHYKDLAFMGFLEVALNLRTILGNLRFCKKDILDFQPDALILIDYPGFNMRIARWRSKEAFLCTITLCHKFGHGRRVVSKIWRETPIFDMLFCHLNLIFLETNTI